MKTAKAQVKMFETIAILVVFFFLLGIGFMFYARIHSASTRAEQREQSVLKAVEIAQIASHLPELEYTFNNDPKGYIDFYKIDGANKTINENTAYYFTLFGNSRITINQTYPEEKSWVIYDLPRGESSFLTPVPTLIYDPVGNRKNLGIIYVRTYLQE
ncbi:hypothetical protein GF336_07060 [Candidatus Woesearchaeota archaeon]|nr:hypothetical protein [Candidatus Woesearchaeota archaeon]